MSVVMPLSNIVRKFAPTREQVVYNMVWVAHDAFEKSVINGFMGALGTNFSVCIAPRNVCPLNTFVLY